MRPIWRVEMLGNLQAGAEDVTISRFRTRRVGLLLAYLAYYGERSHSRDELADMLWPECDADLARRNLRQALSSLRRHLEPPSLPSGAVLVAKQARVSLNMDYVATDVAEFCSLVAGASSAKSNAQKIEKLKRAVEIYKGDLLPGYYEDWVQRERLQLEDLLVAALQSLVHACEAEGQIDDAIRYVRLALAKDHLKEDLHATLMRLYLASERPASALQHFQDWKTKLADELHDEPGEEIRTLAERAQREGQPKRGPGRREKEAAPSQDTSPAPEEEGSIAKLPVQLTRFFGRAAETEQAVREVGEARSRLVSLLGPAGAGKTRLSIQVGRRLAEQHGWNVWFVPLADFSDGAMVLDAVADAMRLRSEAGASPLAMVQAHLSGEKNLLILDNLEHILESAVAPVESILREVPNVSILVTSRQSLKLGGEREIDLDALPIPSEESGALADFSEVPSVQLFVDRAQAILPDFQVTPNNAKAIAAICSKLDGLPLALEIAAGLSNAFTPSQLVQNLENRLEILRSRRRDIGDRHRSLRAAIDYSYDLLTPAQQRFFVALSVFRGGFTVEAATRICLKNGKSLRMILDLQERSLLRSEEAAEGSPARFRLLESFREYGAEILKPEEEEDLRRRHATYYLELGKEVGATERENRLAALQFFFERGEVHECVVLLEALHGFSLVGQETTAALINSPQFDTFDPMDRIILLRLVANNVLYQSEYNESLRVSQKALEIATEIGRDDQVAIAHQTIAIAMGYLGRREDAIAHNEKFLCYAEQVGNFRMIEHGHNSIGTELWSKGDCEGAMRSFENALVASKKLERDELPWPIVYNLSRVSLDLGNLDDGLQYAGDGLRIVQAQEDPFGISMFLGLVSRYHRLRGNLIAALATSHEALVKRRKVGFLYWTLNAIHAHAMILVELGRYRDAATLFAASRNITKLKRAIDDREYAEGVQATKANLSEAEFEQAWAEGLAMSVEEAFRLAVRHR